MRVFVILTLFGQSLTYGNSCQFCAISGEYLLKHPGAVEELKSVCVENTCNLPCECDAFHKCDRSAGSYHSSPETGVVIFGECVVSASSDFKIAGVFLGLLAIIVVVYSLFRRRFKCCFLSKITQVVFVLLMGVIVISVTLLLLIRPPPLGILIVMMVLGIIIFVLVIGSCLEDDPKPQIASDSNPDYQAIPATQETGEVFQPVIAIRDPEEEEKLAEQGSSQDNQKDAKTAEQIIDERPQWVCSICTLLNPQTSGRCGTCGVVHSEEEEKRVDPDTSQGDPTEEYKRDEVPQGIKLWELLNHLAPNSGLEKGDFHIEGTDWDLDKLKERVEEECEIVLKKSLNNPELKKGDFVKNNEWDVEAVIAALDQEGTKLWKLLNRLAPNSGLEKGDFQIEGTVWDLGKLEERFAEECEIAWKILTRLNPELKKEHFVEWGEWDVEAIIAALVQETKNLGQCSICLVSPLTHLVAPCGHACMCEEDARHFRSLKAAVCPICRTEIESIFKIYTP